MKIRFYIDPESGIPHFYHQEVREGEIEDILRNLGKTVQTKKTLALLSGRQKPVDISERSAFPILFHFG